MNVLVCEDQRAREREREREREEDLRICANNKYIRLLYFCDNKAYIKYANMERRGRRRETEGDGGREGKTKCRIRT